MKRRSLKNYWIGAGFILTIFLFHLGIATAAEPTVVAEKMVTTVEGSEAVVPGKVEGQPGPGCADTYNYPPYNVPGEMLYTCKKWTVDKMTGKSTCDKENKVVPCKINPALEQFYNAYDASCSNPVQTTDWWSGAGLQWSEVGDSPLDGWAFGYNLQNPVVRTKALFNEPFQYQFVDLPDKKKVTGLDLPVQGLRLWNQHHIDVKTHADAPGTNIFCRGPVRGPESPIVTVGLKGVHPISSDTGGDWPLSPPWTNIKIKSYSDWGVVMAYKNRENDPDSESELTITMANGSPFTWFERTAGHAPFRVWAGADASAPTDTFTKWFNEGTTLGLTVDTTYNSDAGDKTFYKSTAAYVVYADEGTWTEQTPKDRNRHMSLFKNEHATKVVVLAMPHNIDLNDPKALKAALTDLGTYAWQKITDTKIHYPPITGSETSDSLTGKPLGYDEKNHVVRTMMVVTTEDFKNGGAGSPPLQIVFPHHRKTMIEADKHSILKDDNGKSKYTWNSMVGELQAYNFNSYVQELQAYGILPFLPSIAVNSASGVKGIIPATDIYDTMKKWFYKGEPNNDKDFDPNAQDHQDPFVRNVGYYLGYSANSYIYGTTALFESMVIADQLAHSKQLKDTDTDIKKSKNAVASEMRDFILQTLKELIGQWADIYTGQFFQYNPLFKTIYGFPAGYGSVQNFNDKHFHWGYFLRSAAAIGRYDKQWLVSHKPLFEKLIADVASFDRNNTSYPFLRNFSPFYGHSWADGTGNGGQGNNQESTSEAINFAVGMIELGQILDNKEWRDIGMYLYEGEILGAQQYWMNQDADLGKSTGKFYNGNWPDKFVHYNNTWINPVIGILNQEEGKRECYWGNLSYADYIIQATPLSASQLHIGRNPQWLAKAWDQFVLDSDTDVGRYDPKKFHYTPYEVLLAGLQARLPEGAGGTGGLTGALERINTPHQFYFATTNAMGKHWAYTLHALGQVDTGVTANTASYGVFKKTDGTLTYVAYNPGANPLTVKFSDGATLTDIPAYAMAYKTGKNGERVVDTLNKPAVDKTRLYLLKDTATSASCGPQTPQVMKLSPDPGTWKPSEGRTPFPKPVKVMDVSAIDGSIMCVPIKPDETPRPFLPDEKYIRTWKGTFSGKRITADPKDAFTRFAIYGNKNLFPGWIRQLGANISTYEIHVMYDFNGDGKTDRWERYITGTDGANTFSYKHKMTEYQFDQPWPNTAPQMTLGGDGNKYSGVFAHFVPPGKGTITVKLCGGWDQFLQAKELPTAISVNADPNTNRASWVQPPYSPHSHR